MEKKLLIKKPMITSWTWIANTFAILENYENTRTWLFNNFVQLFCEVYDNMVSVHYIPHVDVFSVSPHFRTMLIPRKIVDKYSQDIVSFIKESINNEYYVYCVMDETKMVNSSITTLHEMLIWGYSDEKREFYVADFALTGNQKYMFMTVSYEQIEKAYISVLECDDHLPDGMGNYGGIMLFTINDNYEHKFDLDLIISSLEDYLSGCDRGKKYRTYRNVEREKMGLINNVYGINIYPEIKRYYLSIEYKQNKFYIQPLHVLCDHSKLMIERLLFFRENLSLEIPYSLIEQFQEILQKKTILRNLGIKYWITKEYKNLKDFPTRLDEIQNLEKKVFKRLLALLKQNREVRE